MPGTLFVVSTPIGNLEDLSFRALRVLREADLIAAEDTRRTLKLLSHHQLRRPLLSLREHNERRQTPRLLARLERGESVALVSDAGTPTLSDPGAHLVQAARAAGIQVVPIPGASAVTAALAASGFPASRFLFLGFPPRSGRRRQAWLRDLSAEKGAVVCFEAPHRILVTLRDIRAIAGARPILVCRELTKVNEELGIYPKMPAEPPWPPSIGEFTLIVGPASASDTPQNTRDLDGSALAALAASLEEQAGFPRPEAESLLAGLLGTDVRAVRRILKKHSISGKQQNAARG